MASFVCPVILGAREGGIVLWWRLEIRKTRSKFCWDVSLFAGLVLPEVMSLELSASAWTLWIFKPESRPPTTCEVAPHGTCIHRVSQ